MAATCGHEGVGENGISDFIDELKKNGIDKIVVDKILGMIFLCMV